jgi:microcin C transport system permease protein
MAHYFFKRLLLMMPTFFGTTFLVFLILSFVPGGPLERAVLQIRQQSGERGEAGVHNMNANALSPEVLESLRKQFGLDQPLWKRYLIWLGLWKREIQSKTVELDRPFREDRRYIQVEQRLYAIQRWVQVSKKNDAWIVLESGVGSDFKFCADYEELPEAGNIRDWQPSASWMFKKKGDHLFELTQKKHRGVLTGDFGVSYVYDEPVLKLIKDRLPVSCYFGGIGFILSYLVCIPLGIWKALHHKTWFDLLSTLFVFCGYCIPGYVLGALLLVYFGGGSFWDWFPLGGFHSSHFETLSFFEKIKDQLHHTFLPVLAYTMGSFATLTMLMKNSLLEQLSQDYVRTALAKGLSEKRVIFVHAFRNSLIPIATGIGQVIGFFLAGSYLIEKAFNIEGLGMLAFKSILSADYPIVMGFLVLNTLVLLLGNLISDLCYAWVDPRIRFR